MKSVSKENTQLEETNRLGADTREMRVRASDCPALANHHIAHCGIADAAVPYEIVRLNLGGTYMLACFEGSGRIFLDGGWRLLRAGECCLAPPHALLAFKAVPGVRWRFAWVRYQQPPDQKPVIATSSPAVAKFDPEPLRAAVLGLWHEMQSRTAPASVAHWVELLHLYVTRFASPWQTDDRLGHLWEHVASRLGEEWSLTRLAAYCHLSGEHLRRLCRRDLGRSPMNHVIYLRMQLAARLLTTTNDKIETIAHDVGYENPFVFSTTFKKWVGWRPSEYRTRHRS